MPKHSKSTPKHFQFGIGRLIIVTNLAALLLAGIVVSNGMAISIGIVILVLFAFVAPALVLIAIGLVELKDQLFGRRFVPLNSKSRKRPARSPFDD